MLNVADYKREHPGMIPTTAENYHKDCDEVIDFGILDQKGRRIGVHIWYFEVDFVGLPGEWEHSFYVHMAPGHYLGACMQATRDGKCYGASQKDSHFLTGEERDTAVNKYLLNARKRALKANKS